MRITSSVTSVSWIPSEAIPGLMKLPFTMGIGHYDPPPPDVIDDLDALRAADRFRFANELRAWIDVDADGRVTDGGYTGGGHLGSTTVRVGGMSRTLQAIAYPLLRQEPELGDRWARFVQTVGGRTAYPMPRTVSRPPYLQVTAPTVWTTLALTLHADGRAEHDVVGASAFPRHWIYDDHGMLVRKSGHADFRSWSGESFGQWSPWGDHDREAIMADAESALERQLSAVIMRGGARPELRRVASGQTLTQQGRPGDELYLVLDGVLTVEVDGEAVAEVGPGAILGERAVLEGGHRTATLRATTPARVAVATADQADREALTALAAGHRREERGTADQIAT